MSSFNQTISGDSESLEELRKPIRPRFQQRLSVILDQSKLLFGKQQLKINPTAGDFTEPNQISLGKDAKLHKEDINNKLNSIIDQPKGFFQPSIRPNAFLKYDSSLQLAGVKAHDRNRFLLDQKKPIGLSPIKQQTRRTRMMSEIYSPYMNNRNSILKYPLNNISIDQQGSQHSFQLPTLDQYQEEDEYTVENCLKNKKLPINKISFQTKYNDFILRREQSNDSLINEYDGSIRNYPNLYQFLEEQRQPFSQMRTPKQNQSNKPKIELTTKPAQITERRKKFLETKMKFQKKPKQPHEEVVNSFIVNQLQSEVSRMRIQKIYDRYTFKKQQRSDYVQLPYDPHFKRILTLQAEIMESCTNLSPQNQTNLKRNFKNIYSKMINIKL